jgi:hypothetical protein
MVVCLACTGLPNIKNETSSFKHGILPFKNSRGMDYLTLSMFRSNVYMFNALQTFFRTAPLEVMYVFLVSLAYLRTGWPFNRRYVVIDECHQTLDAVFI